jgi:hypothetical protein
MILNPARNPPTIAENSSTYHFPVAAGVVLGASDKSRLIDVAYEYRVRHGGALDTIEREIDDYYCTRWPTACVKENSDYGVPNSSRTAPVKEAMLHRVSRWAAGVAAQMPKGGYPLVTTEEARRRQDICAICCHNRTWRTGCKGCSGSAAQLLMQVRGLRKGRGDVYGCFVAGWDNSTATSMDLKDLPVSGDQMSRLAEKCWRR